MRTFRSSEALRLLGEMGTLFSRPTDDGRDTAENCAGNKRVSDAPSESERLTKRRRAQIDTGVVDTRRRKRNVAIVMGYKGEGYYGMQCNRGVKTIEGELITALQAAGLVADGEKAGIPRFMRAARTDKGVSAAMQVVSMKLPCEVGGRVDPQVTELINTHLPPVIRVYGLLRATASFNARTDCHRRRYEYLLPLRALGGPNSIVADGLDGGDARVQRLEAILRQYMGTHCFSNFTENLPSDNAASRRYVIEMRCSVPFLPTGSGVYYVAVVVFGQSFVLHQIRKMVGLALFVFWGCAPECAIRVALSPHVRMPTPTAPALGLLLDELYFDQYNSRYGGQLPAAISIESFEQAKFDFKLSHIYAGIAQKEREKRTMEAWKRTAGSKLKYDEREVAEKNEKFVESSVGIEERRRARIQSLFPILTDWSKFADDQATEACATATAEQFFRLFYRQPNFVVRVPGRVNIIGEHLDYNELPIIGVALQRCTIVAGCQFNDGKIEVGNVSRGGGALRTSGNRLAGEDGQDDSRWLCYVSGGVAAMVSKLKFNRNKEASAGRLVVGGNLAVAQGLASSSSLVVACALATARLNRTRLPRIDVAGVAAEGERAAAGTNGGAGDHAVVMSAEAGSGCIVHFSPRLQTDVVRLPEASVFVLVSCGVNACKGVGDVQLLYNTRVAECRVGSAILARRLRVRMHNVVQSVGGLLKMATRTEGRGVHNMEDLMNKCRQVLKDDETLSREDVERELQVSIVELENRFLGHANVRSFAIGKRMAHVMSESMRVEQFVRVVSSDAEDKTCAIGAILNDAHASLRDNFECSTARVDEVVLCCLQNGAAGARIVGAGWGGNVLSVVRQEALNNYLAALRAVYGKDAATVVVPSAGASVCVLDSSYTLKDPHSTGNAAKAETHADSRSQMRTSNQPFHREQVIEREPLLCISSTE